MSDLDRLGLAMLAYREKRWRDVLEILEQPLIKTTVLNSANVSGRAYAAMSEWRLWQKTRNSEHRDRAKRLLAETEAFFKRTVLDSFNGMYPPYFPEAVMMERVLWEADLLIDPEEVTHPIGVRPQIGGNTNGPN